MTTLLVHIRYFLLDFLILLSTPHFISSHLIWLLWSWNYKVKVKVAQLCLTVCDPMDCSLPGASAHGILQVRILEWVAVPFSRRACKPRDWTQVPCIAGGFFTTWATRETQAYWSGQPNPSPEDLPTQESNYGLLHCREIFSFYQLSYIGN